MNLIFCVNILYYILYDLLYLTGTCSGVRRSSSDVKLDGDVAGIVRLVREKFASESLHCSTSTSTSISSSISVVRSTDRGPKMQIRVKNCIVKN